LLRRLLLGSLVAWLLTTGSSCQILATSGAGTVAASGAASGIGLAVYAVGGAIYCAIDTDECFPDKEALQARAEAYARAQTRFTAGLRLYQAGNPEGLELICLAAHEGYAIGQFFYGSHLLKREPQRRAEAITWLRRAAAQGHRMAAVVLGWEAEPSGPPLDRSALPPADDNLPDQSSCTEEEPSPAHGVVFQVTDVLWNGQWFAEEGAWYLYLKAEKGAFTGRVMRRSSDPYRVTGTISADNRVTGRIEDDRGAAFGTLSGKFPRISLTQEGKIQATFRLEKRT
jgi:hypothetical protein